MDDARTPLGGTLGRQGKQVAVWLFVVSLTVVVFVQDFAIELGVAGGVPYVIAVLATVWLPTRRETVVWTLVCTALTVVGFFISPTGGDLWKVILNRLYAVLAICGTGTVIVVWKQAQRRRLMLERRASRIISSSDDGMVLLDTAGRVQLQNPAAKSMNAAWQSTGSSKPNLEWLDSDSRARVYERIAQPSDEPLMLSSGNGAAEFEATLVGIEGTDDDWAYLLTLRDVSARRAAEREQKRAEQELRLAATAFESQEGMLISDPEGTILRVNKSFTEITGYQAEEAVGRKASLLKSDHHEEAFYRNMWQTLGREGAWHGEIWNRRKDGGYFPAWLTVTAVKAEEGQITHYVGTLTDLTQRKEAEEKIRELAFYDQLTHLPNRRLLMDRLQRALASANRSKRAGVLLFIDLDNFKILNDTFGHDHGDLLLREVAQRLGICTRNGDTVARLGGDEFVVLIEGLSTNLQEATESARVVSEKILTSLTIPYQVAGHEHHSTPSIGVTLFSNYPQDVDELLKQADIAMYQAKSAGRNTVRFYDPEMRTVLTDRASLEFDLRQALLENQFLLCYQPQVETAGRVTGAEALIRWQHPVRGIVSPAEFIPLAEDTGQILALGQWVLETACKQLVRWGRRAETAGLTLAVNVSARQFRQERFVDEVLDTLRRSGAVAERLELELTESLLLDDVEDTIIKMTALKNEGVRFSLDDFGTGYSSLAYLKRLPLHQLKIDQSFVRDVLSDPNDAAIASTVVALGQSLGLKVIAEGVENQEQRDFLFDQGCYAYQGYLFGRPVPVEEFERVHLPLHD